jgi:hypothetical protein
MNRDPACVKNPGAAEVRPGEAIARFCGARGKRVLDVGGALFVEYRRPFFQSVPYDACMDLDPAAVDAALRARRVVGVRYPTMTQPGWSSGVFVCDPRSYTLEEVEPRHRKQVEKGLARCAVREVDPDELLLEGPEMNRETLLRQGRSAPEFVVPALWRRFVDAIRACPGLNVTGAYLDGRLSAYAVLCRDGAAQYVLYRMTRTADMIHRTNPALDFMILANAARDPTLARVVNGGLSFVHGAEGLHRYKQLLGYRIEPHDVAIRLHPALAPALTTRAVVGAAGALSRLRPANPRLELVAHVLAGARLARGAPA